MDTVRTTPQILEVANFTLLRAMLIALENRGVLSADDIRAVGAMAVDMCGRTRNDDPASSIGAAQLIAHWIATTFG